MYAQCILPAEFILIYSMAIHNMSLPLSAKMWKKTLAYPPPQEKWFSLIIIVVPSESHVIYIFCEEFQMKTFFCD